MPRRPRAPPLLAAAAAAAALAGAPRGAAAVRAVARGAGGGGGSLFDVGGPAGGRDPYDFAWRGDESFDEMWADFGGAVPLEDLQASPYEASGHRGPACHPSLDGPRDGERLAILLHGFTGCPGSFSQVAVELVSAGFRVLRPVLPGHGRRMVKSAGGGNVTLGGMREPDYKGFGDDISRLPDSPEPYLFFIQALGRMARAFKAEHPDGLLVTAGHSLGGLLAAGFSMEAPEVVDRAMFINPFSGLTNTVLRPALSMAAEAPVDWDLFGEACKSGISRRVAGGYCQFKPKHILALANLAYVLLCQRWGVKAACAEVADEKVTASDLPSGVVFFKVLTKLANKRFAPTAHRFREKLQRWLVGDDVKEEIQKGFGRIPMVQMVSTRGDGAVNHEVVKNWMAMIEDSRKTFNGRGQSSYCKWPSAVGHRYMMTETMAGDGLHYSTYVQGALLRFLEGGEFVDVVQQGRWHIHGLALSPKNGYCLTSAEQVSSRSTALTVIPASMHQAFYRLSTKAGAVSRAHILFQGWVRKESEFWHVFNPRHVELIELPVHPRTSYILVTRLEEDADVRDVFRVRELPSRISYRKKVEPSNECVPLWDLEKLDKKALVADQVVDLSRKEALGAPSSEDNRIIICSRDFVKVACGLREEGCERDEYAFLQ